MSQIYLYRRGNGNEGNYPHFFVTIEDNQCPYAALKALAANERIPGTRTRRHIIKHIETDGEIEYGIHGTVYEGPDGEESFGSAWLTCELEPYSPAAVEKCVNIEGPNSLRDVLDRSAWRMFRKDSKGA